MLQIKRAAEWLKYVLIAYSLMNQTHGTARTGKILYQAAEDILQSS